MGRTLMFGSIAAVLRYNGFSRIIEELARRIFGIPRTCYFDDFGPLRQAT